MIGDWSRWLLLGLVSLVFGVLALGNAVAASMAITWVTGTMLIIAGLFQIVFGFSDDGPTNKFISVMIGVLMAVLGVSFLINPFEGMMSLSAVITLIIGAAGVLRLFWAFRMRATGYFWMMLLSGSLSVLLAGYIFANFERASTKLLGILLGLELVVNGAALVVLALFLRAYRNRF